MKKTSMILTAVLAALTITATALARDLETSSQGSASPYGDAGPASPYGDAGPAVPEEVERAEPKRFSGPILPIASLRLTSCEFSCSAHLCDEVGFITCVGACMASRTVHDSFQTYLSKKERERSYGGSDVDHDGHIPPPPEDEEDSGEMDDGGKR